MRRGKGPNVFDDDALFSRVETIPESGCWIWMMKINNGGYGVTTILGRHKMAHRAVFEFRTGIAIPRGMHLCHRCDVRSCVNPDHMFIGTAKENAADKLRKGRQAKGEKSGTAKVTEDVVRSIRADVGSYRQLGLKYGLGHVAVRLIRLKRTWRHVT